MNTKEFWKDVKGYEGIYQVSNLGNVINLKSRKSNPFLKPVLTSRGYFQVFLFVNCPKRILLHRLVAEHFILNIDNKPQVNHINGIKTDNRVENLEWVTAGENMKHGRVTGLINSPKGERHPNAKITQRQVDEIRNFFLINNYSVKELSQKYNVSQSVIYGAVTYRTYK